MAIFSDDVNRLVHVLFQPRPWRDGVRGHDQRHGCLEQLAACGDVRVVPVLLPIVAVNNALSAMAARAILR